MKAICIKKIKAMSDTMHVYIPHRLYRYEVLYEIPAIGVSWGIKVFINDTFFWFNEQMFDEHFRHFI